MDIRATRESCKGKIIRQNSNYSGRVKRVLVITNSLSQASYRLRMEALIGPLGMRGIQMEVRVRPRGMLARRMLLKSADAYDATILQRKLLDGMDARLLARRARRVLFDVDDAVMYCNTSNSRIAQWRTWRRFLATAKNADTVVAGNNYLAELFQQHGADTCVLPTVVEASRYQIKRHAATESLTLVWIGSQSTLPYLKQILPTLEDMSKVVKGMKLLIIADEAIQSSLMPIEHVPWSAEGEVAALLRGDIGIAPTPRDRWTEGKCGFKIVQYMAAGLPVIASPVGANEQIVVDGMTGILAQKPAAWSRAISTLAENVELRAAMGAAGRARAEKEYNLQRAVDVWERLLQEA
jgi:hypothetical protein